MDQNAFNLTTAIVSIITLTINIVAVFVYWKALKTSEKSITVALAQKDMDYSVSKVAAYKSIIDSVLLRYRNLTPKIEDIFEERESVFLFIHSFINYPIIGTKFTDSEVRDLRAYNLLANTNILYCIINDNQLLPIHKHEIVVYFGKSVKLHDIALSNSDLVLSSDTYFDDTPFKSIIEKINYYWECYHNTFSIAFPQHFDMLKEKLFSSKNIPI